MPRRRNRFSRLEAALRLAGGTGAAGSDVGNYAEFKAGRRKVTIGKVLNSDERVRQAISLHPFNIGVPATVTAASRYRATVTTYSATQIANFKLGQNDMGWYEFDATNQIEGEYYPAILTAFTASGPPGSDPETSGITGRKYKKTPGTSCSIPFGRTIRAKDAKAGTTETTLANSDEEDVRKHLTILLKAAPASGTTKSRAKSVGYTPEVFRSRETAVIALSLASFPAST